MLACACMGVVEVTVLGGAALIAACWSWLRARFGGAR